MNRSRKQGDISDIIGNQAGGTQGRENRKFVRGENEMQGLNEVKTQSLPW